MSSPVLIGNFLHRIKRPIKIESTSRYKLVTVKLKHKGVVLREEKFGAEIKSSMYQVKAGDFILSGIDARNGAFGIVPPELDGAVVTNDFWYFEIDDAVVDKNFFLELTATHWFDEICRKGSDGTTQRIRLQKNKFFNQVIYLPNLKEQRLFNRRFQAVKVGNLALTSELAHQKNLLKKLRQQILQEAIEGKLTADWRAQNPDIEPASELLKRIAAEKAQPVKDKKIKAQKPLPPITDEEKPFELPQEWEWCRLGDISINSLGKMLDQQKNKGTLKSYLRNLNVQWHRVYISDLKEMPFEEHETEKYSVTKGDIVICEGGYPGQAAIWEKDWDIMFQKALHRVRFISACFNSELFVNLLWLWDANGEINKHFTGAGIKHLTGKSLNKMPLPLPSLEEQKIIVAKVEKLLALCDQLETQITQNQTHAEQLMQAVLKEAFSHSSKAEPVSVTPQASTLLSMVCGDS